MFIGLLIRRVFITGITVLQLPNLDVLVSFIQSSGTELVTIVKLCMHVIYESVNSMDF